VRLQLVERVKKVELIKEIKATRRRNDYLKRKEQGKTIYLF
jgi:hypothetical protein